ncbi:hypothetical protein ROZALSC1DRAFT_22732, partial [Rozella allomycis CSF55]
MTTGKCLRILMEDPTKKRDLMRAVGSVINFASCYAYRDEYARQYLVFEEPQTELGELQAKKIQNSLSFNDSVTSSIMKSVEYTVQNPLYVDCSNTSIRSEQDLSMVLRRELEISLKENFKKSAMAIKKLKIKNQKQIYKIYLFNSEQVISILKLPIGQRILDNSGNSINFAESFENIIKSANNFIIFKKISKSKPNFRDRETKEVLSTIAAKTTFKNPNLLFIETMSYAKSMELINYLNNNGKLFGCDWYQSNGRSSKEEHHLQHLIRNLQNDKSQANYKRPNFELPVPITPVMENKGSVRLSEEQLDSEMDETFAGPIDDPDNPFNTAIKESSIGKAYGFLRLRKRRTSFCISHTAHPNSRPMTTKRRPAKKGKKKYCTLCCFQGNIESNDKIISIMHQNVRGL